MITEDIQQMADKAIDEQRTEAEIDEEAVEGGDWNPNTVNGLRDEIVSNLGYECPWNDMEYIDDGQEADDSPAEILVHRLDKTYSIVIRKL